jgi:hypothetical protein
MERDMLSRRLDQGPFGIEQDEGWYTIKTTTPSDDHIRNFGTGLIGYTWEESGPSIAARQGRETLEEHVEKLASLPFVDVLYIRCDWRDVQSRPGRLDLHPIWDLTFDAAKRHNLRVGFRVQLSSPNIQPDKLSLPDFLQPKVPLIDISKGQKQKFIEPAYYHPEFLKAFRELNELLAAEFDNNPLVEFVDLMMYGFWGEGHTGGYDNPFPDYLTAEKTMAEIAQLQLETWKKAAIAANTQPDISRTGNKAVLEMALHSGCWLRSDSILIEEPIQIDILSNRPACSAAILEDGYKRQYKIDQEYMPVLEGGITDMEDRMLHALEVGANYWSLWTEADNLKAYNEKYPNGFETMHKRMGYRVRPSWIWQRRRYDTTELIIAFVNDGVSGVPGVLRVWVESMDGKMLAGGTLDSGHPYAGKLRQASFLLPMGMDGQKVKLRAELETKGGARHGIRWACAQQLNEDGSITIELKSDHEKWWRKNV